MTDYGHDLLFGSFITPSAAGAQQALHLAQLADAEGLDLVTFQDHPYQPSFLDTWTLMTWVAARTARVRIVPNVINLPLRPPAVLARQAASLDALSGGRFELGVGSGAFWDGIEAMGGRRLAPGQAVTALSEGIDIIRELWDTETRGGARVHGEYYSVDGAKRGPAPAHPVGIWIGAYKPKMLALTGAKGDGWLPSLDYLPEGVDALPALNAHIDAAAERAGRPVTAVRRLLNVMRAEFSANGTGFLAGPPRMWAEQLADVALLHGISGFVLGGDDAVTTQRFAAEVAPAVREIVTQERG
jgi:alkanesulfonate monooxygenase SsuD/methylene tetrahydromethanopterin reductase-like flavin-dependent oxidoreductase (luciferase family)